MDKATAIGLFVAFLMIVAFGAGFLKQYPIMLGAFVLIILIAIFSFGTMVRHLAEKQAKAKADPYAQFPGSLFKEGATGVVLNGIIWLVVTFALFGITNVLLNKPLLDNWLYPVTLAIIITVYQYYTYNNYKKLKEQGA